MICSSTFDELEMQLGANQPIICVSLDCACTKKLMLHGLREDSPKGIATMVHLIVSYLKHKVETVNNSEWLLFASTE